MFNAGTLDTPCSPQCAFFVLSRDNIISLSELLLATVYQASSWNRSCSGLQVWVSGSLFFLSDFQFRTWSGPYEVVENGHAAQHQIPLALVPNSVQAFVFSAVPIMSSKDGNDVLDPSTLTRQSCSPLHLLLMLTLALIHSSVIPTRARGIQ